MREQSILFASTFKDLDIANKAQMQFVKHYEKEIAEWVKNGRTGTFTKTLETGQDLGNIVGRGKFGVKRGKAKVRMGTKVEVMLAKDGTEKGFHIVTSYPTF